MRLKTFTFADAETGQPCSAFVTAEHCGLCVKPEGTATADGNYGPIFLEVVHGRPVLYVWPDVNGQEPIKIDLTAALESNRQTAVV